MQWMNKIELSFRVYLRQHEDVEHRLNEVVGRLDTSCSSDVNYGEAFDTYWPIRPQDVEVAREHGLFVTEKGDKLCLVIRELPITLEVADPDDLDELLVEVSEGMPLNQFAVIRVLREALTEIQAI